VDTAIFTAAAVKARWVRDLELLKSLLIAGIIHYYYHGFTIIYRQEIIFSRRQLAIEAVSKPPERIEKARET
jgi:hypothetical protein